MSELSEEEIARAIRDAQHMPPSCDYCECSYDCEREALSVATYALAARAVLALLQPALERARREVDQAREMRKRLDKRIHCQRKANRDNWEIVEQRRKWLGSQASQRAWVLMRNRALAAEAKLAALKAPSELADEIEKRRLKFADPADGYYEMLSDEEHEQIAAAIRKG